MSSIGSGFRVLEARDRGVLADPRIVAFRLDPATLDFAEVSGNAERLLGFPADEWCRPGFWYGRIHPDDHDAARAFFAAWTGMRPDILGDRQLEYRVIDAAGQTVWIHQVIELAGELSAKMSGGARPDARRQDAVRGVLMDVSERVAREAEVAKALILKTELLLILAEELAPPLRAISVYAEMLERHLASQRDDVGSDYALGLRDGVQRLGELMAQLMRAAQNGNMSVEEMGASLAALRAPRSPG
jgi:signal transduction histidine kinase